MKKKRKNSRKKFKFFEGKKEIFAKEKKKKKTQKTKKCRFFLKEPVQKKQCPGSK